MVTAAGAAPAGISMDLQSVLSTALSWKTCLAAAVGKTSRYRHVTLFMGQSKPDNNLHNLTAVTC